MKKLIIIQTVVPDYRKKLFTYIKENFQGTFTLYGGDVYFEKSVKSDDSIKFKKQVKNYFLFNREFLFQTGFWDQVLKNNVIILELNPRIISNWIILVIRKIFNKKTILWGHAWPRAGKNSSTDNIRNLMRTLANEIIAYTKTQQNELTFKMPNQTIKAAPNAVFYKNEMIVEENFGSIKNIIYVGRLAKNKKTLILVEAFHRVIKKLPEETTLILVGRGEESETIKNYVSKFGLANRIKILGHIGDYQILRKQYSKSLVSVSPGYIGLSVTQSFGFGVPMIVSKNENHSPEIEAVIEGKNAVFFKTDDIDSLSQEIVNFFNQKEIWIKKRTEICNFCRDNYSLEAMAENFIN